MEANPVIPVLYRLRLFKFKVSLGHRVNSCLLFKRKKVTSLIYKHIGKYTPWIWFLWEEQTHFQLYLWILHLFYRHQVSTSLNVE